MVVQVRWPGDVSGHKALGVPKRTRVVTLEKVPGSVCAADGAGFDPHDHRPSKNGHAHDTSHTKRYRSPPLADPANARVIALHMAEVVDVAPEQADRFRRNAVALGGRLDALDMAPRLGSATYLAGDRPYLVFHDAYQYFERRYALSSAVGDG